MKKFDVLEKIKEIGLIAVIRGDSKDEAIRISEAAVAGGITGIELTFTVPEADLAIKELVQQYQDEPKVVVGAGTVLDEITARLAILSGAQFIVSPFFKAEIATLCNAYQIPYLPGCMTITEAHTALSSGVDIIKLFPSNLYQPNIIKTFKAPMPQLNVMPTGGVTLDNMSAWFEAGAVAVGIGSDLVNRQKPNDVAYTKAVAKQFAEQYALIAR